MRNHLQAVGALVAVLIGCSQQYMSPKACILVGVPLAYECIPDCRRWARWWRYSSVAPRVTRFTETIHLRCASNHPFSAKTLTGVLGAQV